MTPGTRNLKGIEFNPRAQSALCPKRVKTSRAHRDRLLDPENDRVQLDTLQRAAAAVGRRLRVELV